MRFLTVMPRRVRQQFLILEAVLGLLEKLIITVKNLIYLQKIWNLLNTQMPIMNIYAMSSA